MYTHFSISYNIIIYTNICAHVGPIGGVLGAIAGLGVDYSINAGVELMHRENFLQDMKDGLNSMEDQWLSEMQNALNTCTDIWIADTLLLLQKHSSSV